MNPTVLRALEDLLRRVLRAADHGIDPGALGDRIAERVARRAARRDLWVAALVGACGLLVLLGWFLAGWSRSG